MFWFRVNKSHNGTRARSVNLQQLDFNRLPILTAAQITDLLHLETRLKSIEKLTGAGQAYYQLLYEPALRQYLESVQLAPASAAHHHAGPGGLVVHTLDVIDLALRKRKSYNLPQRSNAEAIAEQEHIWTYAIFAGAILHDIGKMVCSTKLVLESGSVWTPYSSLAQGLLTGKFGPDHTFAKGDHRFRNKLFQPENYKRVQKALENLRPIAKANHITLGQLALAWIISRPGICAIAGARNAEQAAQNADAAKVRLSEQDLAAVNEIGKTVTDPLDDDPIMWSW